MFVKAKDILIYLHFAFKQRRKAMFILDSLCVSKIC